MLDVIPATQHLLALLGLIPWVVAPVLLVCALRGLRRAVAACLLMLICPIVLFEPAGQALSIVATVAAFVLVAFKERGAAERTQSDVEAEVLAGLGSSGSRTQRS